jgi:hypothetical protein
MRKNNVAIEDAPAAPALTPEMVSTIKKEDMRQAVFERFSSPAESPRTAAKTRKRSPHWQPADDQC